MDHDNPGRRRDGEHCFTCYQERVNCQIFEELHRLREVLTSMKINIGGIEHDEDVLAQVIPFLTTEVTTLQAENKQTQADLQNKVAELEARSNELATDETAKAAVEAELAKVNGELAQVEKVVERLRPIAEEAEKVLPSGASGASGASGSEAGASGAEGASGASGADEGPSGASGSDAEAVVAPQAVYLHAGGGAIDSSWSTAPFVTDEATPRTLFYFAGDTPGTDEANGAGVPEWEQYTGPIKAAV